MTPPVQGVEWNEVTRDATPMDQETKDFLQGLVYGLNKRFDTVDKRFDSVDRRLDGMETRLGGVEGEMQAVKAGLAQVTTSVSAIDERLTKLEATVDEEKAILLRVENTLSERIHADEDDLQSVRQRVERIEDHVGLSHSLDPA